MTHREKWEEVSFQVFTDESGVLRSGYYPTGTGLVEGNVQVDRVWGNIPMQPDDDRTDSYYSFGGGDGDRGWNYTWQYTSDTLRTGDYSVGDAVQNLFYTDVPADSHTIATTGWSNFPGYIPNYAGDGDSGLEAVVPNIMRQTLAQAEYMLDAVNLNLFAVAHNPTINYIESTGTTVRVWAYDNSAWGDDPLVGLKVGDKVWVDNDLQDFGYEPVTITARGIDEYDGPWIEFEVAEAFDPILDSPAMGTIWPGPDLVDIVTVIRFWNPVGSTKNENTNIHVRYLGEW